MPEHDRPERGATSRVGMAWAVIVVLVVVLVTVLFGVLRWRFTSGEIYPHYSSLRSDPLGTLALYQALERLPGREVRRNLRPLSRLAADGESAILMLGVSRASLAWLRIEDDDPVMRAVRDEGATLVLAINPGLVPRTGAASESEWWQRFRQTRSDARSSAEVGNGETGISRPGALLVRGLGRRALVAAGPRALTRRESDGVVSSPLMAELDLALVIPENFDRPEGGWSLEPAGDSDVGFDLPNWFSQCRIEPRSSAWRVLALTEADGRPVVVERDLGRGRVVVCSGVYFASNEALWKGANSGFLLRLIGDRQTVVFDESIHGARQSPGLANWIIDRRLHGGALGALVIVGLLAWRMGSPLLPPASSRRRRDVSGAAEVEVVSGQSAEAGLLALLRRSLPTEVLLERCLDLWRKTEDPKATRGDAGERFAEVDDDPVSGYRKICQRLQRRRRAKPGA